MVIDLAGLCKKYRFIPRGVIHVGAYTGEEWETYKEIGIDRVIFIEALPELARDLQEKFKDEKGVIVFNCVISDKVGEIEFNITGNKASSSILKLAKHAIFYPNIKVEKVICLPTYTLDFLIKDHGINMAQYDMLNMDVQGAELLALKGMGENFSFLRYIYTEVNVQELYKGCVRLDELDKYLGKRNFVRRDTHIYPKGWGDAFYIKK